MSRKRKLSDNEIAAIIGIIAGLLMLFAGVSGATAWDRITDFLQSKLGTNNIFRIVSFILVALASLGGILVIFGSLLIRSDRVRSGRLLIWIGAGFGIIGLLLFIVIHIERQEMPFASGIGLGAIGVILSIVARLKSQVVTRNK